MLYPFHITDTENYILGFTRLISFTFLFFLPTSQEIVSYKPHGSLSLHTHSDMIKPRSRREQQPW
jgi:hypothetical protein